MFHVKHFWGAVKRIPHRVRRAVTETPAALRRIPQSTIWSPGMLDDEEKSMRSLKRIVFPGFDILMLWSGFSAILYGAPSIESFLPPGLSDAYGTAFALSAAAALLGIAFPALWAIEITGKLGIFALSVGYVFALFLLAYEGDEARNFVIGYVGAIVLFVGWRLAMLGTEWHTRNDEARGA